jgi:hypothetical protein
MSTPNRVTAQIKALDRMLENVTKQSAPAIAAIKLSVSTNDGYPTTASGSDNGPGGSSGSSSVERAVERRLGATQTRTGPVTDLEDVSDYLSAAALAFDSVIKILARYSAGLSDAERQALRCIGDGTPEGASCDRWAARKGMCDRCYLRARRRVA